MKKLKSKLFSFFLPESLKTRIENYQKEKLSISISAIIISAIDEYLESRGF